MRAILLSLCHVVSIRRDSQCTGSPDIGKEACLTNPLASCMWLSLEDGNHCMPCKMGPVDFPCPSIGGIYGGKKVLDCQMKCGHHKVLSKVSACVDTTGTITQSQCFSKGLSAATKCMWTQFTDARGEQKAFCGPCSVMGIGKIPCVANGMAGPVGGSSVDICFSQCDEDCWGSTQCRPTEVPPPVIPAPVPLKAMHIPTTKDAPDYFAVPVNPPYGVKDYNDAAMVAARAAGWPDTAIMPPDAPVVVYGPPPWEGPTLPPALPVMMGPPPPGIPGIPPAGYGTGTVPPPEMVEESKKQKESLLSRRARVINHIMGR